MGIGRDFSTITATPPKENFQHQPWCIFLAALGVCWGTTMHLRSVPDVIFGTIILYLQNKQYEINSTLSSHPTNQTENTEISFTILNMTINENCSLDSTQLTLGRHSGLIVPHSHSCPQRPRSFQSPLKITTSGPVQQHSGFEWLCKHNRLRPELIRFVRLDSEHKQSNGSLWIADFQSWTWPEVMIFSADQKDRSLWGRECLMVGVLDSRSRGLGLSPGRGHSAVFMGKTLNSQYLSPPPRCTNGYQRIQCWG